MRSEQACIASLSTCWTMLLYQLFQKYVKVVSNDDDLKLKTNGKKRPLINAEKI